MERNLTLILDDNRFEVDKEKLASKSCYFESLCYGNYKDSHNKEYTINYDISVSTFKDFLEWIHEDNHSGNTGYIDDCYSVKHSMVKFAKDNFADLLNLLRLSILFTVDELTNDIVDIIVSFWLMPKTVLQAWLLAQELSVKVLQDICFSVCLDYFEDLPLTSLVKLNEDTITSLLQNVNLRASSTYLHIVRNEWMQFQTRSNIPAVKEERKPKYIQGTVVYRKRENIIRDGHLYTWDGINFSKDVQIKNIHASENGMIGMQVISKGFSIYVVGGEMGIGTGKFNRIIWRYCLISKKWYFYATLPIPRRHMVAAFVDNKLILVGGVGRHRLRLHSVSILDIHTGLWSYGAEVPESFTMIPFHCVMDGKLLIMNSNFYIYYPKENCWKTLDFNPNNYSFRCNTCFDDEATFFSIGMDQTVLSRVDVTEKPICEKKDCLQRYLEHWVETPTKIRKYVYELDYISLDDVDIAVMTDIYDTRSLYFHIHTELRKDFADAYIPPLGCFKIIDPDTLYNTV